MVGGIFGISRQDRLLLLTSSQVGPEKYRDMWVKGETAFPKRTVIEPGEAFSVPSRETGREIPCRIMMPESSGQVKGVYMHIHGGGWVLQSEAE